MSSIIQRPWKKESSKTMSHRVLQSTSKKETKTSLDMGSDEEVPEPLEDDDDDDDSEDDEDLIPQNPEKKRLARITESHVEIIALCKKTQDTGRKKTRPSFVKGGQALENFKTDYGDVLDASGDDKKTLLHHLAKRMTKSLLPLLRWLLKIYPELIFGKDFEDQTALHTAIASQNASFVEEVCEHSEKIVEVLQQTGVHGTCLHKALELQNSTQSIIRVVVQMIKLLRDDPAIQKQGGGDRSLPLENVLRERDKEGNTPLHVALTTVAGYIAKMDQVTSASVAPLENNLGPMVDLAIELVNEHPETMFARNKKTKSPYDCLEPAKEAKACSQLLEEMQKGIMRKLTHDEVIDLLYTESGSGM